MTNELIPMLDKMAPILGPEMTSMFRLMALAEEEISAAVETAPLDETAIQSSFCLLCPRMTLFEGKNTNLYRHHCREIIARVVAGEDTRPGTKAEVLATLSSLSLISTIVDSAHRLMEDLMAEILPEFKQPTGWEPHEAWPGAVEETLAKCRAQTFDDKRTRTQKRRS